jgi:predicted DNA-binding transcriptional regulator YafY
MVEQQKIYRVFKLISLLADKPKKTAKQLATSLDISIATVYKYIILLESLGYNIDKDERDAYFLFEETSANSANFEIEEMALLNQLISSIEPEHPLKQSLLQKVYLSSPLLPLADEFVNKSVALNISKINTAIAENRQIEIKKYHSVSSGKIGNRIVEPILLVKSASQLVAYDIESESIKQFKIKRMTEVEILETKASHSKEINPTDIFGFSSNKETKIQLQLSTVAYKLLVEEFPDAKIHINQNIDNQNFPYTFQYEVRSLVGVGRFILGLLGEIIIDSPIELKNYLNNKISTYKNFNI